MDFCVLGLLAISPMSLYDLNRAFERWLGLFYSASLGSIRATLAKLQEKGWIRSEEDAGNPRGRKVFTLEASGREAFRALMLSPLPQARLEDTALARYHFLGLLPDRRDRAAALAVIVRAVEDACSALEQVGREVDALDVPDAWKEAASYQRATLDYGLAAHRAGLEWFRAALAKEELALAAEADPRSRRA